MSESFIIFTEAEQKKAELLFALLTLTGVI